jgi:Ca2+-binding EF-hand superfamily protein
VAVNERETITKLSLEAILHNMGINIEEGELLRHIREIKADYKEDEIDYELFVRVVALSLELKNFS